MPASPGRRRAGRVEMMIPLRILRFSALPEQSWDLQVRRFVSDLQEVDEWSVSRAPAAGVILLKLNYFWAG